VRWPKWCPGSKSIYLARRTKSNIGNLRDSNLASKSTFEVSSSEHNLGRLRGLSGRSASGFAGARCVVSPPPPSSAIRREERMADEENRAMQEDIQSRRAKLASEEVCGRFCPRAHSRPDTRARES